MTRAADDVAAAADGLGEPGNRSGDLLGRVVGPLTREARRPPG